MRIIVNELPRKPSECLFNDRGTVFCNINKSICSLCFNEECGQLMQLGSNSEGKQLETFEYCMGNGRLMTEVVNYRETNRKNFL